MNTRSISAAPQGAGQQQLRAFRQTAPAWIALTFALAMVRAAAQDPFTETTNVWPVEASSAASWFDADNDGDMDLFMPVYAGSPPLFYRNDGGGTFTKLTNGLANVIAGANAGPVADFDNDGLPDLYVVRQASGLPNLLFRNAGNGSWAQMPGTTFDVPCTRSSDASWLDHDRDGFVDLFVQNGYGSRVNDTFYRNLGNGTFHKLTVGLGNDNAEGAGCAWSDYDNDGWPDVFLTEWTPGPGGLFRNDGHGNFSPAVGSGIELHSGYPTYAPTWVDYDNDGRPDLFLIYFPSGPSELAQPALYRNLGNGTFADVSSTAGIMITHDAEGGEMTAWGDYDNDGFVDFIDLPWRGSTGLGIMNRNRGDGSFEQVDIGSPLRDGSIHQSITWVDYNNDGFLDLFLVCGLASSPERPFLYQNNLPVTGNTNHWLKVKLLGTASNGAAIGAKVRVLATIGGKPHWQVREISGNYGYLSREMPSLIAHFGLGDATTIDLVRIEWPSGNVQELTRVTMDQQLRLTEPAFISPPRPTVSWNGSVTLTRTAVAAATYQWQFDGGDLPGQTNRLLNLTNVVADQEGRYSVTVSNATSLVTNYVYLRVDPTFIKVTEGPVVTDRANFSLGSFGDYDDDGFYDLLVPAGMEEVANEAPVLYHNVGGTNWIKMTTTEVDGVVATRGNCYQALWADFDNDAYLDLLEIGVTAPRPDSRLFMGRADHTFEWRSSAAGLNLSKGTWQCALVDYDNDGLVDVYQTCGWADAPDVGRDVLCRNLGNGNFANAWSPTGPILNTQYGCWGDYDNDGDRDLWLLGVNAGWRGWNGGQFYRNNGDGTLSQNLTGTEIPEVDFPYGTWGDYDNDGYLDFLCGTTLLRNNQHGGFTSAAKFPDGGGHWSDYDNDGDLDVLINVWGKPGQFFRNDGNGAFTAVDLGSPSHDVPATECLQTWCDYNNDGFLDLFVATRGNPGGTNFLYRSSGIAGGNTNHWLIIKPRGTTSNRSAIGAKVRILSTIRGVSTWQMREIQGGYFDELRAHFGLGDAGTATTLRIEWPSGTVQEFADVPTDQILSITEPRRPVLAVVGVNPTRVDGSLRGDPSTDYVISFTDDLSASWTELPTVTTDATGAASWSDSSPTAIGPRCYKASRTP